MELWQLEASEIAARIKRREVSALEVTQAQLARIDAVNPAINAVVQDCSAEALETAERIDQQLVRGEDPGPLAGVPVTIKVIVDQAGYATTNGLRLQKDLIAEHDSPVVANLKNAGAVIVGRTNTPAFSLRWFCRNGLHGWTKNPLDPGLTPGGSSGGASAGLAAGIGAIAHGTDIGGSIRYPAYACGLHGLRPTLGRVPAFNATGGDRMIGAQVMAVSGPLARSIEDLRLGLAAMSAPSHEDPWWVPAPLQLEERPKHAALCLAPSGMAVAEPVRAALLKAADMLRDAGWSVDEAEPPPMGEAAKVQATLWLAEFRRNAAATLKAEGDADALFVYAQMERLSPPVDLNGLMDALQARAKWTRLWQGFFEQWPVLLCPVSGELPFPDQRDVESPEAFARVMSAQLPQLAIPLMGLPGLTVTTGRHGTAPVGVQLVAGRYREDLLLQAGAEICSRSPKVVPQDPVSAAN